LAISAVNSAGGASASTGSGGLDFQSLLNIILTQLTYQDPLKPLDNFQFVSQLAQFSQLEQSQTLNTTVANLLASQSTVQAVSMLGHTVSLTAGSSSSAQSVTGKVTAVNLSSGQPSITITTSSGQVLTDVSISSVTSIQ
jgi:flagellar basal-body rod modification protein FlgD